MMSEDLQKMLDELEQAAHSTAIDTPMITVSLPFNSIVYKHMKSMLEELIHDC